MRIVVPNWLSRIGRLFARAGRRSFRFLALKIRRIPFAEFFTNDFVYFQLISINLAFQVGMWLKSFSAALVAHAVCMLLFAMMQVGYRLFRSGVTVNFRILPEVIEEPRRRSPPVIRSFPQDVC